MLSLTPTPYTVVSDEREQQYIYINVAMEINERYVSIGYSNRWLLSRLNKK